MKALILILIPNLLLGQKVPAFSFPPIVVISPANAKQKLFTANIINLPSVTLPNPLLIGRTLVLPFTPAPNSVIEVIWRDANDNPVGNVKRETGATTDINTRTLDLIFPTGSVGTVEASYSTFQ